MGKKQKTRSLHFATILYPESCNPDFRNFINQLHICAWLSPLHAPDPEEGNFKEHYHLLLSFDSLKSRDQVKEILEPLNSVGVELINSRIGYARYLIHLDNPEKQQFDGEIPESWGWIDYSTLIDTEKDISDILAEIMDFCCIADITSYQILCDYCRIYNKRWFRIATQTSTVFLTAYLKSRKYTVEKQTSGSDIKDVVALIHKKFMEDLG